MEILKETTSMIRRTVYVKSKLKNFPTFTAVPVSYLNIMTQHDKDAAFSGDVQCQLLWMACELGEYLCEEDKEARYIELYDFLGCFVGFDFEFAIIVENDSPNPIKPASHFFPLVFNDGEDLVLAYDRWAAKQRSRDREPIQLYRLAHVAECIAKAQNRAADLESGSRHAVTEFMSRFLSAL